MPQNRSPRSRSLELDFIRGIAILAVLDYHFADHSPFRIPLAYFGSTHFGWIGVDLFFILSGFLVGGLLMKEWKAKGTISGARFLKRRAFKIWPAYYFFILVEVIVRVHPLHTFLLGNLLNIQNYTGSSIPHTWSLAVEEHFYLLLTLLLVLWAKKGQSPRALFMLLMCLSLAVILLRAWLAYHGYSVEKYTHTRIDALFWGVMLAVLFHFYPDRFISLQGMKLTLYSVALASLVGLVAFPNPASALSETIANVGCGALFLLLYQPRENHSWLYRVVATIGVYSYGIYLWHLSVRSPLALLAARAPHSIQTPILAVGPYISAIVLGIVVTKMIEFPLLRLRERLVPPGFADTGSAPKLEVVPDATNISHLLSSVDSQ
jgi:peptidoglycan/LPS O-acetylase OafA/YrhL